MFPDGENSFAFKFKVDNLAGGGVPIGFCLSASEDGVNQTNGLILNAIDGYLQIKNLSTLVASLPMNVMEYHSVRVWNDGSEIYVSVDGNKRHFTNASLASQISSAVAAHTGLTLSAGGSANTAVRINTDLTNSGWVTQNTSGNIGITDDCGFTTLRFGNSYNAASGELAKLDNKILPLTDNKFSFMFKVNNISSGSIPFALSWSAAPNGVLNTNGIVFIATNGGLQILNRSTPIANVAVNMTEFHYVSIWYDASSDYNRVLVDGVLKASFQDAEIKDELQGAITLNTGLTLSAGGDANNAITFGYQPNKAISYHASEFAGTDDDIKLSNAFSKLASLSSAAKAAGQMVEFRLLLENRLYYLAKTLVLQNANNITIVGNGASFIFTDTVSAFYINKASNIHFSNLSIDYDPLIFTQGVIESVIGNLVTVNIDSGYRSDLALLNNTVGNDGLIWSNIHDRETGGVQLGTQHSYAYDHNVALTGNPNQIRLTKVFSSDNSGRQPVAGDVISLFQRGPSAFIISNSEGTKLNNINLLGSPGFGVAETSGKGGSVYTNVNIIPGEKPAGATYSRLKSVNGDGAHFGNVEVGPTFDRCAITHSGDDGINIQGFFFRILEVSGNQLIVSPKWDTPLQIGETIEGYKGVGLSSVGTAKITAFSSEYNTAYKSAILAAYANCDSTIQNDTLIYRITLDKSLALAVGDQITSLNRIGSGALIKNSTFAYNRARGVVVKGTNILIENNTFTANTHPAIVAAADMYWCESGFVQNIVIRGNYIIKSAVCSNITLNAVDQIGSILISEAPTTNVNGFYNNTNNKNILIENNIITDSQIYGIFAINCDGITIRNNTVTNSFMNGAGNVGAFYGVTPKSGIFVGKSTNVTVTNNFVTSSSIITQAVDIHSSCFGSIVNVGNPLY